MLIDLELGCVICSTIDLNIFAVLESGNSVITDRVVPTNTFIRGSIGNVPRCGTPARFANSTPPLEENIFVQLLHFGHTNLEYNES